MPGAHPLADRTRPLDQGIRASRVNTGGRNIIPDAWAIRPPSLAGTSEKRRRATRDAGSPGQTEYSYGTQPVRFDLRQHGGQRGKNHRSLSGDQVGNGRHVAFAGNVGITLQIRMIWFRRRRKQLPKSSALCSLTYRHKNETVPLWSRERKYIRALQRHPAGATREPAAYMAEDPRGPGAHADDAAGVSRHAVAGAMAELQQLHARRGSDSRERIQTDRQAGPCPS